MDIFGNAKVRSLYSDAPFSHRPGSTASETSSQANALDLIAKVETEVDRLIMAKFIREVQYPVCPSRRRMGRSACALIFKISIRHAQKTTSPSPTWSCL